MKYMTKMGNRDRERYWQNLIKAHEQSLEAYSNQKLGELVVFGEFLSRIEIDFDQSEIYQPNDDPPDIIFREHKFEVLFDLGGRKPHEEAKMELLKVIRDNEEGRDVRLVTLEYPNKLSFSSIIDRVEISLRKKSEKYATQFKNDLNILVCIMQNIIPDIDSPFPDMKNLFYQGWLSVSLIVSNLIIVLHANAGAPSFIENIIQKPVSSQFPHWWTPKQWE